MTLGAFVDLGVPVDWLQKQLSPILNDFAIKSHPVRKSHLAAIDITIETTEPDHTARTYKDIKGLIEASQLPEAVKTNSLTAFHKIALAESHIHQKDIDTIHFHEIGGVDSLVDIIGSFLSVHYLGVDSVHASAVPLGSGYITCAHGTIPVPVPATLAILKDIPVKTSDAATEIVTPTGAAIIATLATEFGPMPEMAIRKTGYGAGKRDTGSKLPNLLRIILGTPPEKKNNPARAVRTETIYVVNTNIDDMNPELSGYLMEQLFAAGSVLDVTFIPVQMKKSRPGTQIEVLCRQENVQQVIDLLLRETTTIGVRCHAADRCFLTREIAEADSRYGRIPVKKVINPDHTVRYIPEYEEAKKIALKNSLPLKDVYSHILSDTNHIHQNPPPGTNTNRNNNIEYVSPPGPRQSTGCKAPRSDG